MSSASRCTCAICAPRDIGVGLCDGDSAFKLVGIATWTITPCGLALGDPNAFTYMDIIVVVMDSYFNWNSYNCRFD